MHACLLVIDGSIRVCCNDFVTHIYTSTHTHIHIHIHIHTHTSMATSILAQGSFC